jgi:hypothetical protein
MDMAAQDDEAVDLDSVLALRATDDADDQVIVAQAGPQQEPAVKRAQGDVDERTWRKKAQRAGHATDRRRNGADPCRVSCEVGGPSP